MDIQQIKYFVTVAQQRSFSKAAQQLFVTQPILTRCVKQLEEELGVPLILRSTRAFALTDAGQTLQQYGEQLLQQHLDIYRHISDVTAARVGEVRIACPGVILDVYFPPLVTAYRRQYPGVRIDVRESGSRSVVHEVLDGRADIGLVMLPLEDAAGLEIFPLVQDEVQVLVQKGHPFASQSYVSIEQLQGLDIITYNQSATLYHTFVHMCGEVGFIPNIAYQSMMPNFIVDTVAYGDCVGVLPAPMLRRIQRDDLIAVPLRPFFPWQIAVIIKDGRYLSHAAAGFLKFARASFLKEEDAQEI